MKPNDKAIEAAIRYLEAPMSAREQMEQILTVAYAAQFPPSEDYAELIETLRSSSPYTLSHVAADALEAVLAERDALKAELAAANKRAANRLAVEAERDALLARLAPVEDEALETIAARTIVKENVYKETQIPSKTLARAAIAAIRPHIEAAEREKCARIADKYEGEWHSDTADACARAIAAAIRSGK